MQKAADKIKSPTAKQFTDSARQLRDEFARFDGEEPVAAPRPAGARPQLLDACAHVCLRVRIVGSRYEPCAVHIDGVWPGRCVQDVALAINDKARHEAFMDTLVIVDAEFSIMASAMATNPPVPKRLVERPAASAAPGSFP